MSVSTQTCTKLRHVHRKHLIFSRGRDTTPPQTRPQYGGDIPPHIPSFMAFVFTP